MRKIMVLILALALLSGCAARVGAASGPKTRVGGQVDVNVFKW